MGLPQGPISQAAARLSEHLPGLRVVQQRGGTACELLRRLYDAWARSQGGDVLKSMDFHGISVEYLWNIYGISMVFNGHATGTDGLEVATIDVWPIFKAYISGDIPTKYCQKYATNVSPF